jgi:hypothetical protein
MKSINRFWLSLHNLSPDYLDEGLSPEERADAIIEEFLAMPPIARRELLADMWPLAENLHQFYLLALTANKAADEKQQGEGGFGGGRQGVAQHAPPPPAPATAAPR